MCTSSDSSPTASRTIWIAASSVTVSATNREPGSLMSPTVNTTRNPPSPVFSNRKNPRRRRVGHVDHSQIAARQGDRAVGPEVDRHAAREQPVPGRADPEAFAHGAAVAVAGDEIARPNDPLLAGRDVTNACRHTVVVLLHVDDLVRVHELGAELAGPLQQDRLQHLLRHEQSPGRAHVFDAGVDVRDVVGDLTPVERLDVVEASVRVVQGQ